MANNESNIINGIAVEVATYYITRSLDQVIEYLYKFGGTIEPNDEAKTTIDLRFPSVCLVGLGRCGSNIALGVSTLVYKARLALLTPAEKETSETDASKDASTEKPPFKVTGASKDSSRVENILVWMRLRSKKEGKSPVYLVEPVVLVGDLDIDISGRIETSEYKEIIKVGYEKLKILDLSEIHHGGAGNIPQIGQYLAKVILNRDSTLFKDENWKYYHSYLIDSPGLKENQSRLFFFIFSAGGGTGSGMAGEFGLAQQYAYDKKLKADPMERNLNTSNTEGMSRGLEQIFSSGIAILPHFNPRGGEDSQAIHVNAGRLICKYLAEAWRSDERRPEQDTTAEHEATKPWNVLMLISNNIMRYVGESQDAQKIDVNQMEKHANQYVSQQIFNILSAQALTKDYDQNYFKNADIDIGDTIRLDAQDLHTSLAGPVAIAYAESIAPATTDNDFDITDVLYRSISLPAFNKETQAIEGISVLPQSADQYRETLKKFKENHYSRIGLEDVKFFAHCSATVTIISIPKDFKLPWSELNKLKVALDSIFPHTKLKRYALIMGASPYLSLTTIIGKSACLGEEVLTLLFAYLQRCFVKEEHKRTDTLEEAINTFLIEKEQDESKIREILNNSEDAAEIMEANWTRVKLTYEKKYREFLPDPKKFVPIDDIRLTVDEVLDALRYIHKVLRHRGVPLITPDITSLQIKQ